MTKIKKIAKWSMKAIATGVAVYISPALGIIVGGVLFFGMETFAAK